MTDYPYDRSPNLVLVLVLVLVLILISFTSTLLFHPHQNSRPSSLTRYSNKPSHLLALSLKYSQLSTQMEITLLNHANANATNPQHPLPRDPKLENPYGATSPAYDHLRTATPFPPLKAYTHSFTMPLPLLLPQQVTFNN